MRYSDGNNVLGLIGVRVKLVKFIESLLDFALECSRPWVILLCLVVVVSATSAQGTKKLMARKPGPPVAPTLTSPAQGDTGVSAKPTLAWSAVTGASSYGLQTASAITFASPLKDSTGITNTSVAYPDSLSFSTWYYWRANAVGLYGTSAWSTIDSFKVLARPAGAPAFAGDSIAVASDYSSTNITQSFTVSNNTGRFMIVQILGMPNGVPWDSIKYGTQKFTLIDSVTDFSNNKSEIWGLVNPAVGTANITTYRRDGGASNWRGLFASVWKNVNQTTPYTVANKTYTQNNWEQFVGPENVTSATGGLVVSFFATTGTNSMAAGSSQTTVRYPSDPNSYYFGIATKAGAASVAISWTTTAYGTLGMWGIPLNAQ